MEKKKTKKIKIFRKILLGSAMFSILFVILANTCFGYNAELSNREHIAYSPVYPTPSVYMNTNGGVEKYLCYSIPSDYLIVYNSDGTRRTKNINNTLFWDASSTRGLLFQTSIQDYNKADIYFGYGEEVDNRPLVYLANTKFPVDDYRPDNSGTARYKFVINEPFVVKNGTLTDFILIKNVSDVYQNDLAYSYSAEVRTVYRIADKKTGSFVDYVAAYTYGETSIAGSATKSIPLWHNIPSSESVIDYDKSYLMILETTVNLVVNASELGVPYYYVDMDYRRVLAPTKLDIYDNRSRSTLQDIYFDEWLDSSLEIADKVVEVKPDIPDLTSWLGSTVAGFFDIEIFYGVKLSTILGIILSITLTTILLKLFAGG